MRCLVGWLGLRCVLFAWVLLFVFWCRFCLVFCGLWFAFVGFGACYCFAGLVWWLFDSTFMIDYRWSVGFWFVLVCVWLISLIACLLILNVWIGEFGLIVMLFGLLWICCLVDWFGLLCFCGLLILLLVECVLLVLGLVVCIVKLLIVVLIDWLFTWVWCFGFTFCFWVGLLELFGFYLTGVVWFVPVWIFAWCFLCCFITYYVAVIDLRLLFYGWSKVCWFTLVWELWFGLFYCWFVWVELLFGLYCCKVLWCLWWVGLFCFVLFWLLFLVWFDIGGWLFRLCFFVECFSGVWLVLGLLCVSC